MNRIIFPKIDWFQPKKNKYLSAKPEIEMIYNMPGNNSNLGIIKNGCKLNGRKYEGETYFFQTTCRFDSIAEIFIIQFNNYKTFNKFCTEQKSNIPFINAIVRYSLYSINFLYKDRFDILFKSGLIENNTIYSNEKIGVYFNKLMENIIICYNCNNRHLFRSYTINGTLEDTETNLTILLH